MQRQIVSIPGVNPVKHLSRAVRFGNLVFVAGMAGRHLVTGDMPEDIAGQTRATLENIEMALQAAGTSMGNVLKTTCYLADISEKKAFDDVYVSYFPADPPARACFEVGSLGPGIKVEIEAIACVPD